MSAAGVPGVFHLLRGAIEPGIWSDRPRETAAFYTTTLGLREVSRADHGPGYGEHVVALPTQGHLQLEVFERPLPRSTTGYLALWIADPGAMQPEILVDPHGLDVHRVPVGHRGVTTVGITCAVADPDRQRQFYVEALGAEVTSSGVRIAESIIFVEQQVLAGARAPTPPRSNGLVDLTVVVDDLLGATDHLATAGATVRLRPLRQGDRMALCWLSDPAGNLLELVEYASPNARWGHLETVEDAIDDVRAWQVAS